KLRASANMTSLSVSPILVLRLLSPVGCRDRHAGGELTPFTVPIHQVERSYNFPTRAHTAREPVGVCNARTSIGPDIFGSSLRSFRANEQRTDGSQID